jgi:hypothetical protein
MGATVATAAAGSTLLLSLLFGVFIYATNMAAASTTASPAADVSICVREGCNCTSTAPHWLIVTCAFNSKQASGRMSP